MQANLFFENAVLSVSDFLTALNTLLEQSSSELAIHGEISSLQHHPSGVYLSLKDPKADALLQCYLPPRTFQKLGVQLEEGLEVKVKGIANIFKPKGRLSFVIHSLELAGEGTLKKAYDLLKKKLEGEGLFARKRPLPEVIRKVGIITSRTGAVIDDFKRNIGTHGIQLYLYDCRVEGSFAADQITRAIEWFNQSSLDIDVLVVMRGGGSLEDLQAFNNETVVRTIFASRVPTICAIGHDRDVPIAQMVADTAPSTPTAAAILITSQWRALKERTQKLESTLKIATASKLSQLSDRVERIASHLLSSYATSLKRFDAALTTYQRILQSADPRRNLALGYSIARNAKGEIIKATEDIKAGERMNVLVANGAIASEVTNIIHYEEK